jgi:hypothetical protein
VLFAATFELLVLEPGHTVRLVPPDGMAAAVIVPFSALFMYLLSVFTFGFAGDLVARQSIYPARMFALPMTTAAASPRVSLRPVCGRACATRRRARLVGRVRSARKDR